MITGALMRRSASKDTPAVVTVVMVAMLVEAPSHASQFRARSSTAAHTRTQSVQGTSCNSIAVCDCNLVATPSVAGSRITASA